ncbi:Uncharacterized protein BP5553_06141 [Venustampulla echinocandica]|uniref:Cell wall proline rich protein n=1 Tax=Venustampulla echinocandica TaxID=2656787 RepID=A0A370TMP6_9HELO|nr:Uncharacterized protein BP5553_06141 [Venustampulla echinocandica]RDL36789.1 Uncharacterized protein BP5553_06141 [Venustampulla echinocandica]
MAATKSEWHQSPPTSSNPLDLRPSTAESIGQSSPGLQSHRASNGPLPLPSFVFPARAAPTSAPSSFSRATGRRPMSAIEVRGRGPSGRLNGGDSDDAGTPELPAFSFGASTNSPPPSPRSRTIPSRPGLHQRGTSEFIGGDGAKTSSNGLMSTSPTKGDGVLPPPTGFGPPKGRRGHRHVRSAAISGHDLSMILKPPTSPVAIRGNSAPCSPAGDHDRQHSSFAGPANPTMQPAEDGSNLATATESSTSTGSTPLKALNRARVGFSDNVEFIPRPLSIISSDSSSTITARQGHSVTNSMSSIISAGTASPSSKDKRSMLSNSRTMMDSRPRTAEPILDRESKQADDISTRRNSIPLLMDAVALSASAPSTPRSAKKWTFFGHDSNSGESSPKSRPTSAESTGKEGKLAKLETLADPEIALSDIPIQSIEPSNSRRSSISRKPSKKQKKVRTWAGSILSRKTRQRSQKKLNRRSPTPPHRSYASMDDPSNSDVNQPEQQSPNQEPDNNIASWKPRKFPPQEEAMSPMIDLDAALGPFNTPSSFGDDWEVSQKGSTKKRAMHSAAGIGGFAGPGMHYHRRAESAPEFENPRFGLHRLGSSSTMAMEDVFEEDEEDEWEDAKASSDKEDSGNTLEDDDYPGLGIDIKIEGAEDVVADNDMDIDQDDVNSANRGVKRKGSSLSEGDRRIAKSEHSAISVIDEPIMEESTDPVEIIDDSSSSRPDSRARSSDSTATPPFQPDHGKELAPVDIQPFTLHPPYLTPTSPRSTTQSSLPSPRSPFSYDTQRISTATSSITDEQGFQSLLLGEPGPEVRYSVDDVPSLTSSNSTMTRDSGYRGAHNPQFRDGQRSASLSSAAVSRKRSSMASLSRLISSSHGEKSKLSIESRPPTTGEMEKKEKASKSKRISRMMQFWKPKETS